MYPRLYRYAPLHLCLPALLLLACGPSAEQREAAEVESARATRTAMLQQLVDRTLRTAGQRCSESPEDFARLLLQHQEYGAVIGGKPAPRFDFLARVRGATARHDSTKSCAPLVDSVARAMQKEAPVAGRP